MNRKELTKYLTELELFDYENVIKAMDSTSDEELNIHTVLKKIVKLGDNDFKTLLRDKNAPKNRVLIICSFLLLIITIIFSFKT